MKVNKIGPGPSALFWVLLWVFFGFLYSTTIHTPPRPFPFSLFSDPRSNTYDFFFFPCSFCCLARFAATVLNIVRPMKEATRPTAAARRRVGPAMAQYRGGKRRWMAAPSLGSMKGCVYDVHVGCCVEGWVVCEPQWWGTPPMHCTMRHGE